MRVESGVVETQVCPVCVLKSLLLSLKLMSIVRRVRQFDVHRLPRAPLPGPAPGPGRGIDTARSCLWRLRRLQAGGGGEWSDSVDRTALPLVRTGDCNLSL